MAISEAERDQSATDLQVREIIGHIHGRRYGEADKSILLLPRSTSTFDRLTVAAHLAVEREDWPAAHNLWSAVLGQAPTRRTRRHALEALRALDFIIRGTQDGPFTCNICGGSQFVRRKARLFAWCRTCKSLERTRVLKLHLDEIGVRRDMRVLHIAPETPIRKFLAATLSPGNYVCADIDVERYAGVPNFARIDLCGDISLAGQDYDLIIHSHVMEHLPCDYRLAMARLNGLLRPGGRQLVILPILPGAYDEDLDLRQTAGRNAAKLRFGQSNHVRRFGADDLEDSFGQLFDYGPYRDYSLTRYGIDKLTRHNIPDMYWHGVSHCTVFDIRKEEFRAPLQGADSSSRSTPCEDRPMLTQGKEGRR